MIYWIILYYMLSWFVLLSIMITIISISFILIFHDFRTFSTKRVSSGPPSTFPHSVFGTHGDDPRNVHCRRIEKTASASHMRSCGWDSTCAACAACAAWTAWTACATCGTCGTCATCGCDTGGVASRAEGGGVDLATTATKRHQPFGSIFPSRSRLVWCGLAGTEDDALGSHPVGCLVGSFGSSSNSGMFKVHPETLVIQSPCENGNGT